MNPTRVLYDAGQSLWVDNITRSMLDDGTLAHYVRDLEVTGLTSNPTIYDHAIAGTSDYDSSISEHIAHGKLGEDLFFELACEDLRRAADLFKDIHERTDGVDGWVSLEVSPLLAYDAEATFRAAKAMFERVGRPNVFVKIPGTSEGLVAIEESIVFGIPVNVTLLFSREQYLALRTHTSGHRAACRREAKAARRIGGISLRQSVDRAVHGALRHR